MLKMHQMERLLRLKQQIRQARLAKPNTRALHLTAAGGATNTDRAIREKAILMQMRLHLEAQTEMRRRGSGGDIAPSNITWTSAA